MPARLHGRIEELEKLVVSLKNGSNTGAGEIQTCNDNPNATHGLQPSNEHDRYGGSMSRDQLQVPDNLGHLSLENAGMTYVDSSHWSTILEKVQVQNPLYIRTNADGARLRSSKRILRMSVVEMNSMAQRDKSKSLEDQSFCSEATTVSQKKKYYQHSHQDRLLIDW